jgi:hypothetical protein
MRLILALFLFAPSPLMATTYFAAPPNTLVNSPVIDATAHTKVNANFNQLVANGNAAKTTIQNLITALPAGGGLPTGAVIMVNAATCPSGYTTADGASGRPDARGVYIRGLDNGAGRDPARALASYQADQLETHVHAAPSAVSGLSVVGTNFTTSPTAVIGTETHATTPGTTAMVAPTGGSETRPDSVVLLYCVK